MNDITYNVTFLTGVMELMPVEYRVVPYKAGPWYWRKRLWAIESEFGRLSGIETREQAESMADQLRGS